MQPYREGKSAPVSSVPFVGQRDNPCIDFGGSRQGLRDYFTYIWLNVIFNILSSHSYRFKYSFATAILF